MISEIQNELRRLQTSHAPTSTAVYALAGIEATLVALHASSLLRLDSRVQARMLVDTVAQLAKAFTDSDTDLAALAQEAISLAPEPDAPEPEPEPATMH